MINTETKACRMAREINRNPAVRAAALCRQFGCSHSYAARVVRVYALVLDWLAQHPEVSPCRHSPHHATDCLCWLLGRVPMSFAPWITQAVVSSLFLVAAERVATRSPTP